MNGHIRFQRAFTAAFCLVLVSPVLGQTPTIWYVNALAQDCPRGTPPAPCAQEEACGTSWVCAFNDLQDALEAATANQDPAEQIWVAAGTYTPGSSDTDKFQLKDWVEVYGGFVGTEVNLEDRDPDPATNGTVLSGEIGDAGYIDDNCFVVVKADDVSQLTTLDGFTITRAFRHSIQLVNDSSPNLRNLWLTDNDNRNAPNNGAGYTLL